MAYLNDRRITSIVKVESVPLLVLLSVGDNLRGRTVIFNTSRDFVGNYSKYIITSHITSVMKDIISSDINYVNKMGYVNSGASEGAAETHFIQQFTDENGEWLLTQYTFPDDADIIIENIQTADFWNQYMKLAVTIDKELSLTSENPVQNKVITEKTNDLDDEVDSNKKAINNIVNNFTNLRAYLYRKNAYLNASNVITYLEGYNLYKIPIKDFLIIFMQWDINNSPWDANFNNNYKFKKENSEGTISSIVFGYGYSNYGIYESEGNAFFICDNLFDAKYIYLCALASVEDTINVYYNNLDDIQLNQKEAKTFSNASYNNYGNFIHCAGYMSRSNKSGLLELGGQCVLIKMNQGDKVVFNGSLADIDYNGSYRAISGTTMVSLYNATEFIAETEVVLFTFLQPNSTREIIYYPVDSFKIMAENVIGLEDTNFNGLQGVAFGTSLTYRSQTTGGFLTKLQELSGITFDNQGIGSSTILGNMLSAIKGYNGYSGKRVALLEGFVNDWWYNSNDLGTYKDTAETTVCGCVRSAINYIYSQNANITLFLILDHYGRYYDWGNGTTFDNSSTALNPNNKTQYEFYEEIAKVAESLGVIVIKQYATSEIGENTPQYLLDNIHMNSLGAIRSAYSIWSIMKKFYPNNI